MVKRADEADLLKQNADIREKTSNNYIIINYYKIYNDTKFITGHLIEIEMLCTYSPRM